MVDVTRKKILITGGAGFVGSALAKDLAAEHEVYALDNLKRRGSEINLKLLNERDIRFFHGDIRNSSDFEDLPEVDLVIDASAEPSVQSGNNKVVRPLLENNLFGTINILEFCKKVRAGMIFLSTSRVYSINALSSINFIEGETRLEVCDKQEIPGVSRAGISEDFPVNGFKSFYGASKLASELIIEEYNELNYVPAIINRFGVISGPGQFGKVDQGVAVLWMAYHYWKKPLSYIGFGGTGKQVRDILSVHDLCSLIELQVSDFGLFRGKIHNSGGGVTSSFSLQEMTNICREITGNETKISSVDQNRYADIPVYISDNSRISGLCSWEPNLDRTKVFEDIFYWIRENESLLKPILIGKG